MAAKVIQISNDDGASWANLPGSEGAFSSEGEAIDDTILGQTFQSNETGLTAWGVSSNGIWKGFAGYLAEIKGAGTPIPVTGESFTVEAGQIYAIDAPTREIWDRSDTVTIYDNAVEVDAADIATVDYLFGRITFATGYSVTGPITADLSYIPVAAIGRANTYSLGMTAEEIDESDFIAVQANSGRRIYTPGLRSVSLELGGIFDATGNYKAVLDARDEIIVEVDPTGDGSSICRGFYKFATVAQSGSVGALEEETLNLVLNVPEETTNPSVEIPFNWRHTNTTLSPAIQYAIASWLGELNTYEVRYLPNGAIGQTPNDGITGDVMFSDISLAGGLSSMNVFQIEMKGNGALTVV